MSDLTNKDAEQDTKIAVIDSTLENSIRRIEMVHKRVDDTNDEIEKLRERVRKLEKWVWGAGAVITAAITLIGIVTAADARPAHAFTNDSLTGTPCATELASREIVKEVSIKSKEEQE